jgi:hypothetical protein
MPPASSGHDRCLVTDAVKRREHCLQLWAVLDNQAQVGTGAYLDCVGIASKNP